MELKNIQNIIHDNMMSYSNYVITNRALPDVRDGMKPVYRRILVSMDKMKISNFTKSANVEGQVMKLHPHGSTYSTIVGMVQPDNNITPLITGKGSFGQHTSRELQAAAQRYTEIKLSDISKDIFKDLGKHMVEFIPNYDGTIMMPEVLPVKFPAVLHYAQSGIAVGMSCNLPSFNLKEINDATKHYLLTGQHTLLVPDFATGGEVIINEEAFQQINTTGSGTIRLRAKATINKNVISVKEIPYTTTREAIIDAIIKLIKSKKITEISNVQDLTGLSGMEIEITAKKNTDMKVLLAKLYKWTPMENTFSANMNILVNKLPKVVGTNEIIETWVKWRAECIRNGIMYELGDLNEKLHRLVGLEKILINIDKAIEIIRGSKENEIEKNLMEYFGIDDIQAEYIANIKLRNLNKDVIIRKTSEINELRENIKEKESCLSDDSKINSMIIEGLDEVSKKYAQPRRTILVNPENVEIPTVTIQETDAIIVEDTSQYKVILTKSGYLKKLPENSLPGKIKDNDLIMNEFIVNNKSEILVFSGNDCYKLYVENLPLCNEDEFGMYLPTQLNVSEIIGYGVINEQSKHMLIVYDNMKVAKIDINSYKTNSRRNKLENSLYPGAKPLQIVTLFDEVNLELHWKNRVTEYNTSNMKVKASRNSQGVTIRNEKIVIKF